ncbi:MAG: VanZ family protein [Bacteroidales bacterium]|nr:VanZ family protein [Bacteroidales bacterium]
MSGFKIFLLHYWKTLSVSIAILVLCLLPGSEFENIHIEFDKTDLIAHFIMFFSLSFVLYLDSLHFVKKQKGRFLLLTSVVASFSFGILTELLQYTIVSLNRSGNLMDLTFDLAGTIAGLTAVYFIKRKSFPVI